MDNNHNGRSYLDDVEEKGYLGLMLAFFRQMTSFTEWPTRREALLKALESKGFVNGEGNFRVINRAMSFKEPLSEQEFVALSRYFGVMFNKPRNVRETAVALNEAFETTKYTTDDAGRLIGQALRHLGDDPDFHEYASEIVADAEKYLAA